MWQREGEKLAFGKLQEVVQLQVALALLDPLDIVAALAAGEQLAEPAVSRAIAWIDQDAGRAVDENDSCADQKFWLELDRGIVELAIRAHHAGERVVIGDTDDGNLQAARFMDIGARIRAATHEREI